MSYNPQNPNGQATSANSAPVVLASDQSAIPVSLSGGATSSNQTNGTQQTKITDGTNVAGVLAPGTANSSGNAVLVGPTSQTQSFSFNSVSAGTAYDVGNYRWVSVQVNGFYTGSTPTITYQTSNDNSTWVTMALTTSTGGVNSSSGTATSAALAHGPISGRYFRLNQTGTYTSGTTTGNIYFSSLPAGMQSMGVTAAAQSSATAGTITTSSSNITSSTLVGYGAFSMISVHGTYAGVSFGITVSDDSGTTFYSVPVYDMAANAWLAPGATITPGTNASKQYYAPISSASTQLKVLASAYTSGTANIRMTHGLNTLPGSSMSQIMDAAGNNRGVNVTVANALAVDGSAVTQPVSVAPTTSGGLSVASGNIMATATAIKTSAGQVYGWFIYNNNASQTYVQFYNSTTGSTSIGTNVIFSIGIPANSGANVSFPIGITFSTAITIVAATSFHGSGGPTNSLEYNIFYN